MAKEEDWEEDRLPSEDWFDAEEDEIQDNPRLKRLRDKEREIYRKAGEAQGRAEDAAIKLQTKYDKARGVETDTSKKFMKQWDFGLSRS